MVRSKSHVLFVSVSRYTFSFITLRKRLKLKAKSSQKRPLAEAHAQNRVFL